MAAGDLLVEVGDPGTATTLAAPGYTTGDSSITIVSNTNWPASPKAVVFAIDEAQVVDGKEVQVAGTYNEFEGTVASATSVTNVDWKRGSGDRDYSAGALTRVYIPVSSERENRIVEWGLVHGNQDGTLKDDSVDTSTIADSAVTTAKIGDGTITGAKLSTAADEIGGAWQTWTPTLGAGGSMTFTSTTTSRASYKEVGKTVFYNIQATGTVGGTLNTNLTFTLPVTAASGTNIPSGNGYGTDGGTLAMFTFLGSTTTANVRRYDNSNWSSGSGRGFNISGSYEAA